MNSNRKIPQNIKHMRESHRPLQNLINIYAVQVTSFFYVCIRAIPKHKTFPITGVSCGEPIPNR